jgi:hypothetical protein
LQDARAVLLRLTQRFSSRCRPHLLLAAALQKAVVLRAYDNRAVYTQRRPDVYLQSEGLTGPTEVVCDFIDGRCSAGAGEALAAAVAPTAKDFGCIPDGSDSSDWLWADREAAGCSARLLVITTPYYPGRHWARSAGEFLPLIEQLEQFHANNFVHGDIRASNVAFCDGSEGRSRLINWDMGGKIREPAPTEASDEVESPSDGEPLKYPEGYEDQVFDATCPRLGQGGEAITKVHDWAALTDLIIRCHDFSHPKDRTPFDKLRGMFHLERQLYSFGRIGAMLAGSLLI